MQHAQNDYRVDVAVYRVGHDVRRATNGEFSRVRHPPSPAKPRIVS